MTRIDGIHHIVSLIQGEVARRAGETSPARGKRNTSPRKGRESAATDLADRLRLQLAAIEADAPDRRRRILRAFIESALVAKFGDAMRLDAAFFRMVEDVQLQMEQSPRIGALVDAAVGALDDTTQLPRSSS
jgi:hypothetical protein